MFNEYMILGGRRKRINARKADPNVFTVCVGDYVKPDNPHPNKERVCCINCNAVMTAFSTFQGRNDHLLGWFEYKIQLYTYSCTSIIISLQVLQYCVLHQGVKVLCYSLVTLLRYSCYVKDFTKSLGILHFTFWSCPSNSVRDETTPIG